MRHGQLLAIDEIEPPVTSPASKFGGAYLAGLRGDRETRALVRARALRGHGPAGPEEPADV